MNMYLNENFDFATAADADVKRAFLGVPDKLVLHTGTKLYKWTSYPLVGTNGITPWWLFVESRTLPSGVRADGFRAAEEYASRLKVSHRAYAEVRAAVSEEFNNSMEKLLLIEFVAQVWAFAGSASGQVQFKDPGLSHVYLIGGSCQLWIPNLTLGHVRRIPTMT